MVSVIWALTIWVWKDGLRRFLYGERDARAPRAPMLKLSQLSTINYQLSIINYQLLIINCSLFIIN